MTTIEAFELVQSVLSYYASSDSWDLYLDGAGNHGTANQTVLPVTPTQEKHPTT